MGKNFAAQERGSTKSKLLSMSRRWEQGETKARMIWVLWVDKLITGKQLSFS
jgi:hypothetical protein